MSRHALELPNKKLLSAARAILNASGEPVDGALTPAALIELLFAEFEGPPRSDAEAISTIPGWSELRAAFFRSHESTTDLRQLKARRLWLLSELYQQLNTADGIGAIYTPTWMAGMMARRAIVTKLAVTLDRTATQIEAVLSTSPKSNDAGLWQAISKTLDQLSIIDPACGTGALLLGIVEAIESIRFKADDGFAATPAWRQALLSRLTGFDIDALAVRLARARLAAWANVESNQQACRNINSANGLAATSPTDRADICIMNPPYVPTYSRRSDQRITATVADYCATHQLVGRQNLFGCFLHRAAELVKSDGVVSAIVPDTFASATSYRPIRNGWRQRFGQIDWLMMSECVFNAQVGSVVVTAGPANANANAVSASELISQDPIRCTRRSATYSTDSRVLVFHNRTEREIWRTMQRLPRQFEEFVTSRDGVNTGPRRMRDILLDPQRMTPTVRPLIEGEDIAAAGYVLKQPRRRIDYDSALIDAAARRAGSSLRQPTIFDRPKLVTRQTADTLIAAVEPKGEIVALNSVHCHQLIDGSTERLWGLCAWLNAPLVRLFYALDGGEQRMVLPQVRIAWLRQLPVPADFPKWLDRLAPMARDVSHLTSTSVAANALADIHLSVCEAAGSRAKSDDVMRAYLCRFPRFAQIENADPLTDASAA